MKLRKTKVLTMIPTSDLTEQFGGRPGRDEDELPGVKPSFEGVLALAGRGERFGKEPGVEEANEQLTKMSKLLAAFELPPFNPICEREFEDWCDAAASRASKQRICLLLFQEAWTGVCEGNLSRFVKAFTPQLDSTKEDLVTFVALAIFPKSSYVEEVETLLFTGLQQSRVFQAREWLSSMAARYIRLAKRRQRMLVLPDTRLIMVEMEYN